jgi:hypothetical protein
MLQGVGMAGNALANSSSGTSPTKLTLSRRTLLREIFTQFKINNYGKSNR